MQHLLLGTVPVPADYRLGMQAVPRDAAENAVDPGDSARAGSRLLPGTGCAPKAVAGEELGMP